MNTPARDISSMTEEEQLHYALQMSMASSNPATSEGTEKSGSVDAEMKEVKAKFSISKQF